MTMGRRKTSAGPGAAGRERAELLSRNRQALLNAARRLISQGIVEETPQHTLVLTPQGIRAVEAKGRGDIVIRVLERAGLLTRKEGDR